LAYRGVDPAALHSRGRKRKEGHDTIGHAQPAGSPKERHNGEQRGRVDGRKGERQQGQRFGTAAALQGLSLGLDGEEDGPVDHVELHLHHKSEPAGGIASPVTICARFPSLRPTSACIGCVDPTTPTTQSTAWSNAKIVQPHLPHAPGLIADPVLPPTTAVMGRGRHSPPVRSRSLTPSPPWHDARRGSCPRRPSRCWRLEAHSAPGGLSTSSSTPIERAWLRYRLDRRRRPEGGRQGAFHKLGCCAGA
jgi:hypothetical protein